MVVFKISDQEQLMQLIQGFVRIMNKFNAGEKRPLDYGTDGLLYRSEVHTIEAIGDKPDINVTDLAMYLGVTKGAISQIIDKLIQKSMVNKIMASPGVNEVALSLTGKGLLVHQKHKEHHAEMYQEIAKLMADCSAEQLKFLVDIQDVMEGFLDKRSQELKGR
jgi:DNA-binding MarR family transcriptional regulator